MSLQPVSRSVTPLRRRMLEDMAMRGLRADTQRDYIRFVRSFAAFLKAATGHCDRGGYPPLPGLPGRERSAATDDQLLGVGAALLLHGDA
jgi:hypothetical protein